MTSLVRQAKLQAFTAGCVATAALYVYTKVSRCCWSDGMPRHARFRPRRPAAAAAVNDRSGIAPPWAAFLRCR